MLIQEVAMYKTKYNDGFNVEINIDDDMLNFDIPTLALQVLVENSLKHNSILTDKPLHLKIYSQQRTIIVSNNITKKKNVISDTTGLKNLEIRYKILSNKSIVIEQTDTDFKVTIPLL